MQLYHDAVIRKSVAMEKMAEARKEKASATLAYFAGTLEMAKAKKKLLSKYFKLLETDTSGYDKAQLERHERLLDLLSMECT